MDEELIIKFREIENRLKKLEGKFERQKVPTENYLEISDLEGDQLTLTMFRGEKTEEKIQNIALLTLLEYKERLSKTKVLSSDIKRNVALNGVPVENFGTHLNKLIPQSILRIGKAKSNKSFYKLTSFGEAKARELKKKLFEDEKKESYP